MIESHNNAVLAVDGGGTRCRVACELRGVVRCVETGAANVSTDFDSALTQIRAGLDHLSGQVGLTTDNLRELPAFIGLAGVTDAGIAARLRDALSLTCARVEDDRPAAVRGALGAQDGLIAHCGTGSFLAVQVDGVMRFAGGWGAILGDEASAQWVGRRALAETLCAFDDTQIKTGLTQKLLADLQGPAGIVRFAGTATPAQFGALAPVVTSAAKTGDEVATYIMRAGASYITETAKRLGWHAGRAICLTGGIAGQYAGYLPDDMQAAIRPPQAEPLTGALALAKEIRHEHL
ncbi:Glucosamine kinase GspK [Ruegeria denitrificans]|uniref:Glucosamine kinase GspK n=1 Tax=Ruegeria denitrificans TaxID=1715692 RepID=A0A0P1IDQ8_9RHOB|nr:BadF/BadG/BcrA/BcrD ATPase family protein [Ruegeria denitrificans]CUJ85353.1 Glucosamine kinase GspK [Ruegeria denitrificans]